jgi:hypothetical protein
MEKLGAGTGFQFSEDVKIQGQRARVHFTTQGVFSVALFSSPRTQNSGPGGADTAVGRELSLVKRFGPTAVRDNRPKWGQIR